MFPKIIDLEMVVMVVTLKFVLPALLKDGVTMSKVRGLNFL